MRLFLLLLVTLLFTAPAQAITTAQKEQAMRIAAQVWEHPCQDEVAVSLEAFDERKVLGKASFSTDDATGLHQNCRVRINSTSRRRIYGNYGPTRWAVFCSVLIHEYGHLTGLPDDRDFPGAVMYYQLLHVNPFCIGQNPTRVDKAYSIPYHR